MTTDERLEQIKQNILDATVDCEEDKDLQLLIYALIHHAWEIDPEAAIEVHNHFMRNVVEEYKSFNETGVLH